MPTFLTVRSLLPPYRATQREAKGEAPLGQERRDGRVGRRPTEKTTGESSHPAHTANSRERGPASRCTSRFPIHLVQSPRQTTLFTISLFPRVWRMFFAAGFPLELTSVACGLTWLHTFVPISRLLAQVFLRTQACASSSFLRASTASSQQPAAQHLQLQAVDCASSAASNM